jgi:hypothetical protein
MVINMKLKKKPQSFKNQREAYWYREGYKDARKQINELMANRVQMYSLDLVDHLPTGDEK